MAPKPSFLLLFVFLACCASQPKQQDFESTTMEFGWVREEFESIVNSQDKESLCRYNFARGTVRKILSDERVPLYFDAIPYVETMYINRAGRENAGIWNLEIETARLYRLVVTADSDERIDLVKSTKAAARYLRNMNEIFKDWRLVVLSYRLGEQAVLEQVKQGRTSPWEIEAALDRDSHFLSRFEAATLYLMRQPTPSSQSCSR